MPDAFSPVPGVCLVCDAPTRPGRAYCDDECRDVWRWGVAECPVCGRVFVRHSVNHAVCTSCRVKVYAQRYRKPVRALVPREVSPVHWEGVPSMHLLDRDLKLWHFVRDPFDDEPTCPEEYFLSTSHQNTRNEIVNAIGGMRSLAISADIGWGKTELWRLIEDELRHSDKTTWIVARIRSIDPTRVAPHTVIRTVADAVGVAHSTASTIETLSKHVETALGDLAERGTKTVLCLDEAHLLPDDTLNSLKILRDLRQGYKRLISIVLLGQPELITRMRMFNKRQIAARIPVFVPEPLSVRDGEIRAFIRHQCFVATADRFPIDAAETASVALPFDDSALDAIDAEFDERSRTHSRASILAVRNLCSNCLVKAAEMRREKVDAGIVREVRAAHIEGV